MSINPKPFSEKLLTYIKQIKSLLSKDYSLQDLKNLKALPKTLQQKMSILKLSVSNVGLSSTESGAKFHYKQLPQLVSSYIASHRYAVVALLVLMLVLMMNVFVISPYAQKVQNQLDMRPAQWSQLQSLIKSAKSSSAAPVTVTQLDDMELQKIRSVLTSRGIKTSVLRLTADNPPRIELQASDAMFSVLLDTLDELRTTWRLYPEQLNVVSSGGAGGAGIVNVGGILVQYSNPMSGVSR